MIKEQIKQYITSQDRALLEQVVFELAFDEGSISAYAFVCDLLRHCSEWESEWSLKI